MTNINTIEELVKIKKIFLTRWNVISKIDINKYPWRYPIYSSSIKNNWVFWYYWKYMFNEELISWSVDWWWNFFYRNKHKFSITNVSWILKILDKNYLDYKYLYYLLSFQHFNYVFDYTIKAHPSVISKMYTVPKISLQEQEKIAEILSTIDETIEKTDNLIEKYKKIKTWLMEDLFTKWIDVNTWKAHTKFKDSKLWKIPESWEVVELNKKWKFFKWWWFSKKDIDNKWFPCITYWEIYTKYDFVIKNYYSFIPWDVAKKSVQIHNWDILFAGSGETVEDIWKNICFIWNNKFYAGWDIVIFRWKWYNSIFLSYMLMNEKVLSQKRKLWQWSSVIHIYWKHLEKIKVALPSKLKEQEKIAEILSQADEKIEKEQAYKHKLENIKKWLMNDLLTGKVRVEV